MPTELTDAAESQATGSIDEKSGRDYIRAALAKIAKKQGRLATYNRYYSGNHPFNFSSEKFTTEFADRLHRFRDNLCPTVVKAPADRLEVIGFSSDKLSDLYSQSWDAWIYSGMPRLSKRIHREAFKTGDAYAIVWADETGRGRIYPQDPRTCCVFYNPETGQVESGAKVWRGVDNYIYLTIYFADRIEKYISKNPQSAGNIPTTSQAFTKRVEDGEAWPLPNPIGTPAIFHFGLEASILDDVIPLNDALNKTLADLLVSSEANSLRQRWTAGIAFEINPETGKQIIPFEGAAQWFATQDPTGKFGQFPAETLKEFLETAADFRNEIASVAGIPQYYFRIEGGAVPSGESLKKAESRFIALIKDAQLDFGDTWSRIMRFVLAIDGIKVDNLPGSVTPDKASPPAEGEDGPKKPAVFEAQWSPADPMSETELVDYVQKKKNVGISTTRALSELGYSDADIASMQKENSDAAAENAANFSKTFNAGPQNG